MNQELKEYIDAVARLNETIDSDEKFEFCPTFYDSEKNHRLSANQTYGYQPTGNEYAFKTLPRSNFKTFYYIILE